MILSENLADDLGALASGPVESQAHLVHRVQNAAMNRLQTVPHIRKSAPNNHAHRIVEIRLAHLVFDVDRNQISCAATASAMRKRGLSRVLRICQKKLL